MVALALPVGESGEKSSVCDGRLGLGMLGGSAALDCPCGVFTEAIYDRLRNVLMETIVATMGTFLTGGFHNRLIELVVANQQRRTECG